MQVVILLYDVRQTKFVGGGTMRLLKSGTQQLQGYAYVYHKNENMRGDVIESVNICREK